MSNERTIGIDDALAVQRYELAPLGTQERAAQLEEALKDLLDVWPKPIEAQLTTREMAALKAARARVLVKP